MSTLHQRRPQRLILAGVFGVIAVALAGVLIATLAAGQPVALDAPWRDVLVAQRIPALVGISLVLNAVGGTLSMTLVTTAIVIVLLMLRRFRAAVSIGLTVALATALSTVLKVLVERPRPFEAVVAVNSNSFPSGHTTAAAALTVAIALLLPRVLTVVIASAWILLMAFARTYLLVHWMSDVVAGAVLGLSVAILVAGIVARVPSAVKNSP